MRVFFSACLIACAACSSEEKEQTAASASSPSSERALCFAAVKGDASVDVELAQLKARAEAAPRNVDLLVLLGRGWIQKARNDGDAGYYLHADACAALALGEKPGLNTARNLQALSLLNNHRFAEAKALAEQMLVSDPEDVMALGSLSDALLELGDVEGAAAAAQRMVNAKPALPSYTRASYLLWLRGDEAGALESIRLAYDAGRGARDHEPAAFALTEAANLFRRRGDIAGALAGYQKALAEQPEYAPALVGAARCHLATGDVGQAAEAVALLERALAKAPLVETAWLLGEARTRAHGGDAEGDAAAAFAKAREIGERTDPRSLALFLATRNEDVDAAARAIAIDQRERGGVYGFDVAALVAFRQGDVARAKELSDQAIALKTPDPRLHVHHAVIHGDKAALARALQAGGSADPLLAAFARELP